MMTPACPTCEQPMQLNQASGNVPAGVWWLCCGNVMRRFEGEYEMPVDHPLRRMGIVR
ncbi:hypothetical protein SAMN05216268_104112 [Streptomyces yunnanensis]|uniref:Uncharacterized protein n=1 Tax=Streptomyces yunnanensis TaxID=156453 RepID=A0A9X8QQN5_9ACTN|nr:hypothetical protein SAMN05216268_104112 [Streptomyces yunnanensis]